MRRTDLIGTTMALSLAVFMSAVATGCGKNDIDTDVTQSEVIETMATIESSEVEQTSEAIAEYEVIQLQVPYMVVTCADTFLMDSPDTAGKIVDLPTDTVLTIIGDVNYGGVATEFYYAEYENNENLVEGYVDGKYIDFNSKVEDSMTGYEEVNGGDGVETTTEEITVPETMAENETEVETIEFEPYVMFTNTACNVRSQPTKDSDLLMTLDKNVGVTVYGEENGWSKVDIGSVFAYIKSSLLSKEQTADPAPAPSTQTQPTQPQSQPAQTQTQPTQPTTPTQNANGTISSYDYENNRPITLTPNGRGWYVDEYGYDRDANGNLVNTVTGEPYVDAFDGTADVPCDGMSIDEMTEILKQYSNLKVN